MVAVRAFAKVLDEVADMDGNGKADLIYSAIVQSSPNKLYYRVGYDIGTSGATSGWSAARTLGTNFGDTMQATDIAAYDFNGNGNKDLIAFHVDDEIGDNAGYLFTALDQSDKVYTLKVRHSGKCMTLQSFSTQDGAPFIQWDCNGGIDQRYTFSWTDDGYYNIINKFSGKRVDISNVSQNNGAGIWQWYDNGQDNQKFSLVSTGDGYYYVKAKHSGKCFNVPGYNMNNNVQYVQYTCPNGTDMHFTLTQVTN